MRWHLCVLGNALILAGCASPYAEVSHVRPHLTGAPGVGLLAAAEGALTKAMHEERAKPLVALADCLTALQASSRELERDQQTRPLLAIATLGSRAFSRSFMTRNLIHGARR
jgi:NAD(P)H-hydrate repair Nnr-like enzyme with NAD(P)H-hydrate dehydratase domain